MGESQTYQYEYFNVTFPSEHVAHVEINRPQKLNAWIETMWLNLGKIFTQLSHDSNIRSILLTGSGNRAFTSGLDVAAASTSGPLSPNNVSSDPARTALGVRSHILEFQGAITAVEACSKPVIVLLHGICFGLAIDLSCAADIRISTKDARMCVKEVDIGLAADIGTLSRLPNVVGSGSWVKEVCLSAREFGAEEAMRVGFVSQVAENKDDGVKKGLELARLIAEKSPVAVLGTKELLNYSRDHTVEEGLNYTAVWNMAMLQTADVKDAMMAGMQKRKAKFSKL